MAVVMQMRWPGVTVQQYEQARSDVNWEGDTPPGAKFHVAWFADDGIRVLDIWEDAASFQRFVDARLTPAVQRIGIQNEPEVTFHDAHAIFAPNV